MLQVNSTNFEKEVLKSDTLVVVDFWASWCPPCLMFAPVFEKVSQEFPNIKFVKCNIDESREIAGRYGVMSIPTIIFFYKGEEVGRVIGFRDVDGFRKIVEKILRRVAK